MMSASCAPNSPAGRTSQRPGTSRPPGDEMVALVPCWRERGVRFPFLPSVFARQSHRHDRQAGAPLAGLRASPVAGSGGGDAEENFVGLNRQEGKADAALDHEFIADPKRILLHGCASVRLGRVRNLSIFPLLPIAKGSSVAQRTDRADSSEKMPARTRTGWEGPTTTASRAAIGRQGLQEEPGLRTMNLAACSWRLPGCRSENGPEGTGGV